MGKKEDFHELWSSVMVQTSSESKATQKDDETNPFSKLALKAAETICKAQVKAAKAEKKAALVIADAALVLAKAEETATDALADAEFARSASCCASTGASRC